MPAGLDLSAVPTEVGPRRWRVFWASWSLLSALSLLWSLATPIGASPDEPAHIIKAAAVARGEFLGRADNGTIEVQVPQYIAWTHAQTCYAFNDEVTADCSAAVPEPTEAIVESTTTAGLYNPVYYLLVGWPSLVFGDSVGVYAIRFVSALLGSLFLALTAMLIASWRRPALPLAGLAVITTPTLLFLSGSVNPNAVEVTSIVAVLAAMLSITASDRPEWLWERSVVLLVAGLVAVNARGLSPLWLAVVVIVPLIIAGWPRTRQLLRERSVLVAISGVGLGAIFAVAWLLSTNSLGNAITDPEGVKYPGAGAPPLYGFIWSLERTPEFLADMIGLFGWTDTGAPEGVILVWAAAIVATLAAGVAVLRSRQFLGLLVLAAAAALLPPIIQGIYITSGGYIWQGRYNLPLVLAALVTAFALLSPALPVRARVPLRLWTLAVPVLALAHIYVFAYVLRRYAVGLDDTWVEFVRAPVWSAPGGNLVLVGLFMATATAGGLSLWRAVRRADTAAPDLESAGSAFRL